jgi:molybdopterin molybdotransferase
VISYSEALGIITAQVQPLPSRTVPLAQAGGVAVASDVLSTTAVPSFANAAMDGFALSSADVRGATPETPVELPIGGSVMAGQAAPTTSAGATAWEITTGAEMPAFCDAVLPVERAQQTDRSGRAMLRVTEPVAPGQNRREAGTDFRPGDCLLQAGDRVSPPALMALAAVGYDAIEARPVPRVAVITTGSEIRTAGLPDQHGMIRDANGPYLDAMLRALGIPLAVTATVTDEPQQLVARIGSLAGQADLLLTTGGVSAGRLDFVPAAIERMGGTILFHKVAIRPGKPVLFARLPGGQLLLGLPGNPMAVAVGLRFFALPAVRALLGAPPETLIPARCASSVRKREGLTFFAKAVARVAADATLTVEVLPGQESFRISPLLRANCWAVVPAGRTAVERGEIIQVAPLLPGEFPGT